MLRLVKVGQQAIEPRRLRPVAERPFHVQRLEEFGESGDFCVRGRVMHAIE